MLIQQITVKHLNHYSLLQLLKQMNIDKRDINIMESYTGINYFKFGLETTTEKIQILKEVRYRYILSKLLFNYYLEAILVESLEDVDKSIIVSGHILDNIGYPDNTGILPKKRRTIPH